MLDVFKSISSGNVIRVLYLYSVETFVDVLGSHNQNFSLLWSIEIKFEIIIKELQSLNSD